MMRHFFILLVLLLCTSAALAHDTNKKNSISLELNRVDVATALKLLADHAKLNLVLADDVQGCISLHLNDVNWDDALDLILKTKGLVKQKTGKTLWVAKAEEMMAYAKQRSQLDQQFDELAPLVSYAIPVHYANVKELATILKEKNNHMLSDRGHIFADERAHLLWLSATPKQVHNICALVKRLDLPLKQVMIEARIVNVDRSSEKNLGVRFGVEKANDSVENRSNTDHRSLPLASSTKMGNIASPFGLFITRLGQGMLLDVQLAALANEGRGEFISNPKLITQDQKTALIQAGEEIPFQEKTHSGATTVAFKKAVLSLEVTPHVLPHKQLLLDLKVNQDAPGVAINDVPMIDTRQIETHVQVQSGQTIVLGGILQANKRHQANRIPFLSQIPVLGYLFQEHDRVGEQRELLVFITPTIV